MAGKEEFTIQPYFPLPVYQKGNNPMESCRRRRQAALLGALLCPASWQRTLSKTEGIPPLHSDQGCLLPLPQAKGCADGSCAFTTALLEICPSVPGTAARTPGQSLRSTHSGSGALDCGTPPGPAAQHRETSSRK